MNVTIDPNGVREMIQTWRDAIDMKIPIKDEFKIHFMTNRKRILENFHHTATSWSLMTSCMQPIGDPAEFNAMVGEIKGFKKWAETEIANLNKMRER